MTTIAQHAATAPTGTGHGLRAWFRRHLHVTDEIGRLTLLLERAEAADIGALEHALTQKVLQLSAADELIRNQQLHIADVKRQLEQAAADRIDHGVRKRQLADATAEIEQLTEANRKLRSEIQNLGSIDVLPMYRDPTLPEPVLPAWEATLAERGYPADDPDVETTQQIRVSTLAAAAAGGAL